MNTNTPFFSSCLSTSLMGSIPSSNSFFSYDLVPRLKNSTPPIYDLLHIPPLLTQDSSHKRLNYSDMGNPVQKKVKYNPEASLYNYSHPQNKQTIHDKTSRYTNHTASQALTRKYSENVRLNRAQNKLPILGKSQSFSQNPEIPRLSNQLHTLQAPNRVNVKHEINNSPQISEQLQQALQLLKQKIASVPQSHENIQKKTARPQQKSVTSGNSQASMNAKLANYGRLNFDKRLEMSWNESPLSTTEESVNSCSTSDLCESDQRLCWTNLFEVEPIIINPSQITGQLNSFAQSNKDEDSLVMKPDFSDWKNGPKYILASSKEIKQEKQVIFMDTESTNTTVDSFRRTPVGPNHQIDPAILNSEWESARIKRCSKLKWDPSTLHEDKLAEYCRVLQEKLKIEINQEKAIQILSSCGNDPKKVYKRIEGREREFQREFIIRPKRLP